ncbi:hypothetical protein BGX27_004992, partial [Mortierella sp. AM989]
QINADGVNSIFTTSNEDGMELEDGGFELDDDSMGADNDDINDNLDEGSDKSNALDMEEISRE